VTGEFNRPGVVGGKKSTVFGNASHFDENNAKAAVLMRLSSRQGKARTRPAWASPAGFPCPINGIWPGTSSAATNPAWWDGVRASDSVWRPSPTSA